ncbi:protein of unknown function [Methanoculleus bourgensis]|uniref:Uncharacterized protein n=1 Tax=Methanoculleus bourgensis TaxID=83986 RepID=A0A0X3BNZ3_9EURY|nr:protein of unknown function [Methanoculleus bourgensis]
MRVRSHIEFSVTCAYFHRNHYSASEFYATDQRLYHRRQKLDHRRCRTCAIAFNLCKLESPPRPLLSWEGGHSDIP